MAENLGLLLFIATLLTLGATTLVKRKRLLPNRRPNGHIELSAEAESVGTHVFIWMRMGVTLILLIAALFIILSNQYETDQQKWAYGVVGTILGYWLRA